MRVLKVYLDTSISNFLIADDAPAYTEATRQFRDEVLAGRFEAYASDAVLAELDEAPDGLAGELYDALQAFSPEMLDGDTETDQLADRIVEAGIIPERYRQDAVHIALTVVNGLDMLVSWNFRHLVKWKTRVSVNGLVRPMGYREIEILSPLEVIEDVD